MISKSFHSLRIIFAIAFILNACGPKQAEQNVQLAGNRNMAVVLRSINSQDPQVRAYFESLLSKSLKETYSPHLKHLDIPEGSLLESPDNLYRIASQEIDDLFFVEIKLPISDSIPPAKPEDKMEEESLYQGFPTQPVEINGSIVNGANLRTVSLFRASTPWNFKESFEQDFVNQFKKASMSIFANPNIYPKSDPKHFANLLYVYSEKREAESPEALSCSNAQDILSYFDKAHELYEKARSRALQTAMVGTQEEIHELNTRLEHSRKKSEILKKCLEDQNKTFEFLVDYGNIDQSYIPFIQKAFEVSKIEELLKKYTNKPVRLVFQLNAAGNIDSTLFLRYDPQRYIAWTNQRVPRTAGDYHIVSLDPYYALMQTMVYMKYALPPESPRPLIASFRNMEINLVLDTLMNGQMSFRVAGSYNADDKRIQLAYPKSIYLVAPGFQPKTIFTRSEEIFQEKGWLAFSSCKTLDGTWTEDGLVMRFLGLECKV